MGTRKPEDIRTLAVVSHGGAGKTSLTEAMLFDTGAISRMGKVEDKKAFHAALKAADFKSIRGNFKFGNNQFPVQDMYMFDVAKDSKGRPYASWVEFGTKHSAANPFFWPSYRALRRRVMGRIMRAIRKAIRES